MKSIILVLVLAVSFLAQACNMNIVTDGIRGSGHRSTEDRTVATFDRIIVEGSMNCIVNAADSMQHVSVSGDDNIVKLIKLEVRDNTLRIYCDENYSTRNSIDVNINVPDLRGIAIAGSSDVRLSNCHAAKFELHIDGSGDVDLAGNTGTFTVDVNGSGDVRASKLHAGSAVITINGSGDVATDVEKSLQVEINGSGDVVYTGNPASVQQNVNGSGSVIKK